MKLLFKVTIALVSFGSAHSQNSFYFLPSMSTKFGVSSTNGFFNYSGKYPENEFFSVYNQSMHTIGSIFLGCGVGWKNEKENFCLELAWNQDNASISNETVLLTSNGTENYFFNQNIHYSFGFVTNRFTVNLKKPIVSNSVHLNLGAGFIYLPGGNEHYSFVVDSDPFPYTSNSSLRIRYTSRATSSVNFNVSLGLDCTIKWNKLYLFTLSAVYSQAFKRNLMIHENYYELTNYDTNEVKKYSYSSASKGSGLILQVSRQLQFFPWKKRSDT